MPTLAHRRQSCKTFKTFTKLGCDRKLSACFESSRSKSSKSTKREKRPFGNEVKFVLPAADCLLLPIVHSTAEELAEYIALEVVQQLGHQLRSRLCQWLEVSVSERPGQTGHSAGRESWVDES